jgi:hypothetical protein
MEVSAKADVEKGKAAKDAEEREMIMHAVGHKHIPNPSPCSATSSANLQLLWRRKEIRRLSDLRCVKIGSTLRALKKQYERT